MTEEITKFVTGAVRSSDCDELRYSLISPIGLKEVAKIANKILVNNTHPIICLNKALECKYQFLSGDKNVELFAYSALYIMYAIQNENQNKYINNISKVDTVDEIRYDLIPYFGLKALARRYAFGEGKYGMFNWERGFPILSLQDHSIEHVRRYQSGDRSDDNLGAAVWGDIASIHSFIMWPSLNFLLRDEGCKLNKDIEQYIEKFREEKLMKSIMKEDKYENDE